MFTNGIEKSAPPGVKIAGDYKSGPQWLLIYAPSSSGAIFSGKKKRLECFPGQAWWIRG